jgi:uncharacterized protein YkwD
VNAPAPQRRRLPLPLRARRVAPRRARNARSRALLLLLLTLSGCQWLDPSTSTTPPTATLPTSPHAPPLPTLPPSLDPLVAAALSPASPLYTALPTLPPQRGPDATPLHLPLPPTFQPSAAASASPAPPASSPSSPQAISPAHVVLDPCLNTAAALYGAHHPPAPLPHAPLDFLEFTLRAAGCIDSSASVHLFYTSEDTPDGFLTHLQALTPSLLSASHIGIARALATPPYRWTWTTLLVQRSARLLSPLPRTCAAHDTLRLHFELTQELKNVELIVMDTTSRITREALTPPLTTPNTYTATITCPTTPGELWIEVLGRALSGPQVLFQAPILVDQPLPRAWDGHYPPDEAAYTTSPAAAERHLLDLINADRAAHGLSPLSPDPKLADIARAHSADMRDNHFFAHTSPLSSDLSARLRAASYRVRASTENIARNTSLYDAHRGLMQSLGHRINILDPNVSTVGIGVAFEPSPPPLPQVIHITQDFALPLPQTSPAKLLPSLHSRASTSAALSSTSISPLASPLSQIAQHAALHVLSHGFSSAKVNPLIQAQLSLASIPYKGFRVQYQTLLSPEDYTPPAALSDGSVSEAAIGVSDQDPDGRYGVITLMLSR